MDERGTTYLEILITCMLLAGFSALGIRAVSGFSDAQSLQQACQTMVSDLHRARIKAISGNLPVTIRIRSDRVAYAVDEPGDPLRWRELPSGLRLTEVPARPVIFYSRGSAVPAGSFTLQNRRGRMKVVVSGAGRVRWEVD